MIIYNVHRRMNTRENIRLVYLVQSPFLRKKEPSEIKRSSADDQNFVLYGKTNLRS